MYIIEVVFWVLCAPLVQQAAADQWRKSHTADQPAVACYFKGPLFQKSSTIKVSGGSQNSKPSE